MLRVLSCPPSQTAQMSGVSLSCSTLTWFLLSSIDFNNWWLFPFRGVLLKTVLSASRLSDHLRFSSISPCSHISMTLLSCLQKPHIHLQYSKIKSDSSREMANSECIPMVLSDCIHRRTGTGSTVGHWSALVHSVGIIHRSQVPSQKAISWDSMQVERRRCQQGFQRHHSFTGRRVCTLHSHPTLPSTANTSQRHHATETRSSSRSFTADVEELIKRSQTAAISKRTLLQYLVSILGWLLALPCRRAQPSGLSTVTLGPSAPAPECTATDLWFYLSSTATRLQKTHND